jgi:hypothetical protein
LGGAGTGAAAKAEAALGLGAKVHGTFLFTLSEEATPLDKVVDVVFESKPTAGEDCFAAGTAPRATGAAEGTPPNPGAPLVDKPAGNEVLYFFANAANKVSSCPLYLFKVSSTL